MNRSYNRNRIILQLVLRNLLLFLLSLPSLASAQTQHLECNPPDGKYEWETWNYYQLLELKSKKNLETKEIRKAYRKQAQLWHPDKQQQQQQQQQHSEKNKRKKTKSSMEECTARFAKIAEAYEVLSDPQKREEYDLFLKHCRQNSDTQKSKWSFRFEKFMDPMQVFEEFFFGPKEDETTDPFSSFFESSSSNQQKNTKRQQQSQLQPIRSYRHEEYLQDPYTGEEIIRLMETQEYASTDKTTGKFYYKTRAQEFKKSFDPLTGTSYYPVSEPYLLEEGYRYPSEQKQQHGRRGSSSSNNKDHSQTILVPGDVLTPRSTVLVSPNQRYYAGLSPDCELLVMADNSGNSEDDVIWSSQNFATQQRMQQQNSKNPPRCFATLRGPHLVVGMERPAYSHQVLWFSEAPDEEELQDDESIYSTNRPRHSTYLAQLDNDGSLVVYKVWNVSFRSRLTWTWRERAWMATSNFIKGQTKADYDVLYSPFAVTYRKCIYATGPMGCFRIARRLSELSLTIYYTIKNLITKVDNKLDALMELLLEEDDPLRVLQNSLWDNGSSIGTKGARFMRRVMQFIMVHTKG